MFLECYRNISKNDHANHQGNITKKHFMKCLCNNGVLFYVKLKNCFSIFYEMSLKYFRRIPGKG